MLKQVLSRINRATDARSPAKALVAALFGLSASFVKRVFYEVKTLVGLRAVRLPATVSASKRVCNPNHAAFLMRAWSAVLP